jgi:hypothetical protein
MSTFCTEDPQFRSRDALYRPTSVYIGLNQCNQRCIDRRQPALLLLPAGRPSPLTPLRDLCKLHACTHLFICVRRRWTNSLIRIYIQLLMKTPTLASICDRSYISDICTGTYIYVSRDQFCSGLLYILVLT